MQKQQTPNQPSRQRSGQQSAAATPQKKPPSTPSRATSTPKPRAPPSEVSSATSRGRPPKLPQRAGSNVNSPVPKLNRFSGAGRRTSFETATSLGAQADVSSVGSRDRPPKLPPRPKNGSNANRRPSALGKTSSFANEGSQSPRPGPKAKARPALTKTPTSKQSTDTQQSQDAVKSTAQTPRKPPKLPPKAQASSKPPKLPAKAPAKADNAGATKPAQSGGQKPQSQATDKAKRPPLAKQASSKAAPNKTKAAPKPPSKPVAAKKEQTKAPTKEQISKQPKPAPTQQAQGERRRPSVKPAQSTRRVSFKDDVRPSTTDDSAPLPDVTEDESKNSADAQPASASRDKAKATPEGKGAEDVEPTVVGKQANDGSDESRKRPSLAQSKRKSSIKTPKPKTEPANKTNEPDLADQAPIDKLAQDNRDLKSVLSEDQCGDVTLLIADITRQMRFDIENHFDASKGMSLIKDDNGDDILERELDFDPATVDIDAYEKERKLRDAQEKQIAKPENQKLKEANLQWYDEWREVVILRVGEAVNTQKYAAKQKDDASPEQATSSKPARRIQKIDAGSKNKAASGPKLDELFPRIKTPLTKLPMNKRSLVLHSVLLLLLSLEHYNAASRVLLLYLTTSLKLGLTALHSDEEKTAQGLLHAAKALSAEAEARKHLEESTTSSARKWKVRLATAAGAAVIGYTGGLAAPMIAAGVGSLMTDIGLGATAAAGYLGTVASNTAVVGALFGAYGGRMTGQVMENLSAGVEDFGFLPLHGERKEHITQEGDDNEVEAVTGTRRLRVVVAISGWLLEKEEVLTPWRVLKPSAEVFALRWELETLLNLGQSFDTMLQSAVYGYAQSAVVKRTVFSELMSGMMWPMALTKVARVVDNPFNLAKTRADKAGQVLAEALINHVQGERPVTLIGYSLGARVIWSCLTTLAKNRAFGLVESAVLMGSPISSDTNTWRLMRSAVTGRLVNVYSENDYLLAFLYRASSLHYDVAGLVPITGLSGVENVDVTETVSGHLRYRYLVGAILQKIRFEDVDKVEVENEAKAFEKVVEEEKEHTYFQQAGELYETYKGKKPQPRQKKKAAIAGGKEDGKDKSKMDMSDADAERQAEKMEKEVEEKTNQSLMQWAAEQLFLSSPADKAKGVDKEAAAKKQASKEGKTTYQWAKDSIALARSGGATGDKLKKDKEAKAKEAKSKEDKAKTDAAAPAKDKNAEAKKTKDKAPKATESAKQGYLATAKGYIPNIRSTPAKPKPAKEGECGNTHAEGETTGQEKAKDAKDEAKEQAPGYSSYLPSLPTLRSKGKGKGKGKATDKGKDKGKQKEDAQAEGQDESAAENTAPDEGTEEAGKEEDGNEEGGEEQVEQNEGTEQDLGGQEEQGENADEGAEEQDQQVQGSEEVDVAADKEEATDQDQNQDQDQDQDEVEEAEDQPEQPTAEAEDDLDVDDQDDPADATETETSNQANAGLTSQPNQEANEDADPSSDDPRTPRQRSPHGEGEGDDDGEEEGGSTYKSAVESQQLASDNEGEEGDAQADQADQAGQDGANGEEAEGNDGEKEGGNQEEEGEKEGQEDGEGEGGEGEDGTNTAITTDTEGGESLGDPFVDTPQEDAEADAQGKGKGQGR